MIAFVIYLLRGRGPEGFWAELVFQFVAAIVLGAIALVGVMSNEDA